MDVNQFFGLSAAAIVLTLVFVLWPSIKARLSRSSANQLPLGLSVALVFLVPGSTLALYLLVGTFEAAEHHDPRMALLRSQMTEIAADLERNPDQPTQWQRIGLIYKDLQRHGSAEHSFRRALYLNPDSAFLHVELAETLKLRSELPVMPTESRELLQRAVALEPDNLKALWLLATDHFLSGNYETAVARWEQMLPLVPEDSSMHRALVTETARARRILDQDSL